MSQQKCADSAPKNLSNIQPVQTCLLQTVHTKKLSIQKLRPSGSLFQAFSNVANSHLGHLEELFLEQDLALVLQLVA